MMKAMDVWDLGKAICDLAKEIPEVFKSLPEDICSLREDLAKATDWVTGKSQREELERINARSEQLLAQLNAWKMMSPETFPDAKAIAAKVAETKAAEPTATPVPPHLAHFSRSLTESLRWLQR